MASLDVLGRSYNPLPDEIYLPGNIRWWEPRTQFAGIGPASLPGSQAIAPNRNIKLSQFIQNLFDNGTITVSGSLTMFSLAADSGTDQIISNTDRMLLSGINGISTNISGTDTLSISLSAGAPPTTGGNTYYTYNPTTNNYSWTSGPNYTFTNGITLNTSEVTLGGTLDRATTINGLNNNFALVATADLTLGVNNVGNLNLITRNVTNSEAYTGQFLALDVSTGRVEYRNDYHRTTVEQSSHGFTIPSHGFIPVYLDDADGRWKMAQANSNDTLVTAYVVQVIDVDTIIVQQSGFIQYNSHGLTIGNYYYLSDSVLGGIQLTPSNNINNVVAFIPDANTIMLIDDRPITFSGGGGGTGTINANNGLSINASSVQLGNVSGSTAARLLSNREVPMNLFNFSFTGTTETVAVPNLNISNTPTTVTRSTVLTRNPSTGAVEQTVVGSSLPIRIVTNNYTVLDTDYHVIADASTNPITITLPNPSTVNEKVFVIKNSNLTNPVNVTTTAGFIDFRTIYSFSTAWDSIVVHSNGVQYYVIG